MGSVPVYKLVLEGADGGEYEDILHGAGGYGARAVFEHFVNAPEAARLPETGERVSWVTLFQLQEDGWVLVDLATPAIAAPSLAEAAREALELLDRLESAERAGGLKRLLEALEQVESLEDAGQGNGGGLGGAAYMERMRTMPLGDFPGARGAGGLSPDDGRAS